MKHTAFLRRFLIIAASTILTAPLVNATPLYWDANGATTGAGATPSGTWGTSNFWNTNSTGGAGTFATATANTDDLFFVAGPSATSGNTNYTVTVSGAQVANSLNFQSSATSTISGGTSITLGDGSSGSGGINVAALAYGATAQGPVTINTAVILNNSQTWTNNAPSSVFLTVGSATGPITLGANTLTFDGVGYSRMMGDIGGTGNLIKNGTGKVAIGGQSFPAAINHTYTGTTTINAGILQMQGNDIGAGNIEITGGVLSQYYGGIFTRNIGSATGEMRITGGVSGFSTQGSGGSWSFTGTGSNPLVWGSANFAPTEFILQASDANVSAVGTFTNNIDLNGSNRTIRSDQTGGIAGGGMGTFSGNITNSTGTAGLIKTGIGLHNLTGTNTYNGGTTISQGTLRFDTRASMPATGNVFVSSGATLGVTVSSTGTTWGGGTGNGGIAGLTAGLGGQAGSTVTFDGNSNLLLNVTAATAESNAITNGGASNLSLIKSGTGVLTLSGSNSYSGSTTITAGTLSVSTVADAGLNSNIGAYASTDNGGLILSGGTLSYTGVTDGTTNRGFQTTANSTINVLTNGVKLTLGEYKPTVNATTLTVTGGAGRSLVINKATVSPGISTSIAAGTTAVRVNALSYDSSTTSPFYSTGNLTVGDITNNGTNAAVDFRGAGATIDGTVTIGSGTFIINQNLTLVTYTGNSFTAGSIAANGSGGLGTGGFVVGGSGTLGTGGTFTGGISANSGSAFQYNSSANQLMSGSLSGSLNVFMTGTGTLTLSGSNGYTGNTTVTNGILTTTKATSQAGYTTPGKVIVNGGTLGVQVGGSGWTNAQVDTLLANATKTSGALGIDTTNGDFTQVTAYTTANLGGLGLTKLGSNKLILDGTNTYTTATTVAAGTLAVNGSLANTPTTVSGGTLQGTGTIGGSVTIQTGGTLAAGNNNIESLSTGALSLESLSTFAYEMNKDTVTGDLTAVTGDLSIVSGAILTLNDLGTTGAWTAGDKLTLISYSGTLVNNLFTYGAGTIADDSTINFSGTDWTFNYNDTSPGTNFVGDLTGPSYVTMTVAAIPEPGAALLGSLGLLALLRRRR